MPGPADKSRIPGPFEVRGKFSARFPGHTAHNSIQTGQMIVTRQYLTSLLGHPETMKSAIPFAASRLRVGTFRSSYIND
jgi:hypothetical protein